MTVTSISPKCENWLLDQKVQAIWKRLESWMLPKLENALTVNASIASLYKEDYGVEMKVLRNVPMNPESL